MENLTFQNHVCPWYFTDPEMSRRLLKLSPNNETKVKFWTWLTANSTPVLLKSRTPWKPSTLPCLKLCLFAALADVIQDKINQKVLAVVSRRVRRLSHGPNMGANLCFYFFRRKKIYRWQKMPKISRTFGVKFYSIQGVQKVILQTGNTHRGVVKGSESR